jgi:large subunit ribosomal protein L6e
VLLVTGPFKINGVPIRRVNARYVIATSTTLNIKAIDKDLLKKLSDKEYFAREQSEKKTGEDAFFKQGDKPEVRVKWIWTWSNFGILT